jgi:Flp pilus assembly protein TadG
MTRISRFTRRLFRENRGSAVIELSFVLPIVLLMFAGMIDVTRVAMAMIDAEQAAQRTTDLALAILPDGNRTSYLIDEAVAATGVERSDVTAQLILECDGTSTDFEQGCAAGEVSARYASVSIDQEVDMLFDWHSLSTMFNSDVLPSSVTVTGDSVVRFQ